MRFRALMALVALCAALGYGCSDRREAPLSPSPEFRGDLAGAATPALVEVSVVQRLTPLAQDVSVSHRVGKDGGMISIPEAGFHLVIPRNALVPPGRRNAVEIRVTALAGSNVAYSFEPHGLVFRSPVYVVQDARDTDAVRPDGTLTAATGAYFPADSLLGQGSASVSEFRQTYPDLRGKRYFWEISHFSGYLLAGDRTR